MNKVIDKNSIPSIKEVRKYIKFVTIAEGGAMGDPGAIELFCRINGKNILYSGNRFYGKKIIDYEALLKDFPKLNDMFTFILPCSYSFRGWKYMNLGCGNNLYMASNVHRYFRFIAEHMYMPRHELYASLYECAFTTLVLLEKGYTSKKEFLEHFDKNTAKNETKYIEVDINTKINTDKKIRGNLDEYKNLCN